MQIKVFTAVAANGNSLVVDVDQGKLLNTVAFAAKGTWGSGTIKLQAQLPDETTWFDVASATRTADGYYVATNVYASKLRLVLSGATSPNLDAWINVDSANASNTITNN